MTKNEGAWEALFEKHGILEKIAAHGRFEIHSGEINKVRESRLMTKFDHRANLPEIFRKHDLSILPVTRGSYVIGDFDAYHGQAFDRSLPVEKFPFPDSIESLRPQNLYSEAAAINCAFLSGMLGEFSGRGKKVVPTVSGRMGTAEFAFGIDRISAPGRHALSVNGCQCEIDGGFESEEALLLVEAKNAISEDFIIRQLYYPYRLWSGKVGKRVVPLFLSYSNDIFHFFEYEFRDPEDYNSIRLVRQRNFALSPESIGMRDIEALLDGTERVPEPEEPFPQADRFERIVDLLGLVAGGMSEASAITENYDFDPRQTKYYTSAAKYLGLLEGKHGTYSLSEAGRKILRMGYKGKYLALAKAVLAHQVFRTTCRRFLEQAARPSIEDVVEMMRDGGIRNLESESTYRRRALTVIAWVDWIIGLQSDFQPDQQQSLGLPGL